MVKSPLTLMQRYLICFSNVIYYNQFRNMAGTFTQLHYQIIFAVRGRENLIVDKWKTELHKYIAGIIKG